LRAPFEFAFEKLSKWFEEILSCIKGLRTSDKEEHIYRALQVLQFFSSLSSYKTLCIKFKRILWEKSLKTTSRHIICHNLEHSTSLEFETFLFGKFNPKWFEAHSKVKTLPNRISCSRWRIKRREFSQKSSLAFVLSSLISSSRRQKSLSLSSALI
jgi:hypothetical protein